MISNKNVLDYPKGSIKISVWELRIFVGEQLVDVLFLGYLVAVVYVMSFQEIKNQH